VPHWTALMNYAVHSTIATLQENFTS